VDPELLEEIGAKPKGSPDTRAIREGYLDRLAKLVKRDREEGEQGVGRIKVRMAKTYVLQGKGVTVPRGREWMIAEEHFDVMNKRLGGNLERVDKTVAMPQTRDEEPETKEMKPEDSVTKE
jgi:hypothetical protein